MVLGAWLRRWREEAGFTQQELADRSGLALRTVSNLEHGRNRRPYTESVRRFIGALGVSGEALDELVAWCRRPAGYPPEPDRSESAQPVLTPPPPEPRPANRLLVVPRQLPAGPRDYVGRAGELAALWALLDENGHVGGAVAVAAIVGTAGVGKTALAVRWAHDAADRFPDGQLYVDLSGFGASVAPVAPADAVRRMLLAFQVAGGSRRGDSSDAWPES